MREQDHDIVPVPAASPEIIGVFVAIGMAVVDGGTATAPTYKATMRSVVPPGLEWTATGITPFRLVPNADVNACATAQKECMAIFFRNGSQQVYLIPEHMPAFVCPEPAP